MERKEYLKLYQNIEYINISGVGEKTIKKLKGQKIYTIYDLLTFFPRDYEDRRNIKKIKDIVANKDTVLRGKVLEAFNRTTRNRKTIFTARISDETGIFEIIWFQMPFLKATIKPGKEIVVFGRIQSDFGLKMVNPDYSIINEDYNVNERIEPIYRSIMGLNAKTFKNIIRKTFKKYENCIFENLPKDYLEKYKLSPRKISFEMLHFPKDIKDIKVAENRFAFEEIFLLEVGVMYKRFEINVKNKNRYNIEDKKDIVKKYLSLLNFELTRAQKRVITEIYKDINNGKIVNRLIQGDVGSGKTIVSIIMLLYMAENGYQGSIMAPTEILAIQHYLGIVDTMNKLGIKVEVLTGNVTGKQREKILREIESGITNIIIGTHALIEDNVKFKNLGLIVIDEQHKFGVQQRKKLRNKGLLSNLLVMSATPIPRSLALSVYGDLDVSIIDELPPGRKPIKTKLLKNKIDLDKCYQFIKKKVNDGRQVYVVCPLIEDSDKMDLNSATTIFEDMRDGVFSEFSVELLHGRLKNEEKDKLMSRYKHNKIDILVSTTVIEVGVDVSNATIMLIMDAHRFGLAQLHQLRGRVGRGPQNSYCFLYAQTQNEDSVKRMKIMEKTNDGFKIAEYDLQFRRSGEIFGTRQSGATDLKFIDIINDVKKIKIGRDEAINYLTRTNGTLDIMPLDVDIRKKTDFGVRIKNTSKL